MTNIGIIILTYNAPEYVKKCIDSLYYKTKNINFTIIVIDNSSDKKTKDFLYESLISNKIQVLSYLESNRFWSKGNNLGFDVMPEYCDRILLLNSDVEILDDLWLYKLNKIHQPGITSYGTVCANYFLGLPERADGYCALIDKHIYARYYLDENFPWWFSITKLQSEILRDGFSVQAIKNHNDIIYHYGGKSSQNNKDWPKNFTTIDKKITNQWFDTNKSKISIINTL